MAKRRPAGDGMVRKREDGRRAAVHDAVYLPVHVLQHVRRAGGAGTAGGVAAGGSHRHAGLPDDLPRHGVIRTAHAHGGKAACGAFGHD